MSLRTFVPKIWAARLLYNLNNATVYCQTGVVNRDYEGDIKNAGDTVRINSIGRVTIGDYTRDTDINSPEQITGAAQELKIDQQKYFNFAIDDVDKAQSQPKVMDDAMKEAAWGLRDVADLFMASKYVEIAQNNFIGSDGAPISVDKTNGYEYLVDLGSLLDDNNVPAEGRWAIVPNWFEGTLLKDDRFVHATVSGDDVVKNGRIGRAAGFDIFKSNNVPNVNGAKYKVMAGHPIAWSFADQILETEAFRPERRFSDAMKGLHVYGGKLTRPTALACLVASKG